MPPPPGRLPQHTLEASFYMVFSGFLERQSQASKFVAFISREKIRFLLRAMASQMGEVIEKASEIRIEESYATFHSKFDYAGA